MKNIHILPTDKLSRLFKVSGELKLTRNFDFYNGSEYQNIYITSDEEIKEGDWVIWNKKIVKAIDTDYYSAKKIILTTDQDLIKDGVQAIDDTFLKWFVKNPSCEHVSVQKRYSDFTVEPFVGYKIIIPQEEPKQETLEEAERMYSEEEVYDILVEHTIELFKKESKTLNEWFEKYKKK
jgi:hypothetical protein